MGIETFWKDEIGGRENFWFYSSDSYPITLSKQQQLDSNICFESRLECVNSYLKTQPLFFDERSNFTILRYKYIDISFCLEVLVISIQIDKSTLRYHTPQHPTIDSYFSNCCLTPSKGLLSRHRYPQRTVLELKSVNCNFSIWIRNQNSGSQQNSVPVFIDFDFSHTVFIVI